MEPIAAASSSQWGRLEAEILVAVGPVKADRKVRIELLPSALDHYTHSLPTPDQFVEGTSRIVNSGLAEVQGTVLWLTTTGERIWSRPHPDGYDAIPWIEERLKGFPMVQGPPVVDPEVWRGAIDRYLTPLSRRLLGRLLGRVPRE